MCIFSRQQELNKRGQKGVGGKGRCIIYITIMPQKNFHIGYLAHKELDGKPNKESQLLKELPMQHFKARHKSHPTFHDKNRHNQHLFVNQQPTGQDPGRKVKYGMMNGIDGWGF